LLFNDRKKDESGMKNLSIQTRTGTTIEKEGLTLQPVTQSVLWLGQRFGFVWNRPYAIRVDDGETTAQVPIVDLTRIAIIILWGLTALFSLMAVRNQLKTRRKDQ